MAVKILGGVLENAAGDEPAVVVLIDGPTLGKLVDACDIAHQTSRKKDFRTLADELAAIAERDEERAGEGDED